MIKTTIIALIEGRRYEFTAELAEVAGWADTANETAIGMLHDSMDQLAKAIEWDAVPDPVTDADVTRQCYLCGFYHNEPGSCAHGEPTNITPGPDDEPEYDGPTMDYGEYEYVDDAEETPEDNSIRPTHTTANGVTFRKCPDCGAIGAALCERDCPRWSGPEDGDYSAGRSTLLDEILETGRPYCDDEDGSGVPAHVRYRAIADAVVEASKRDEVDQ